MAKSTKDSCYFDLRARILRLDITPSSALDETSLSAAYGLSRTPLREVFQRLAGEGFLMLEPNRGAVVAAMDLVTMRQFFQTAPLIYSTISRLAAQSATPTQIKTLKDAQHKYLQAKAANNAADLAICNHRFHEVIGEMAANPYLLPSLNRLLIDHTRMSRTFYSARTAEDGSRIEKAARQHDELIEAIEKHAPELAVEITLDHWALSRHQIEKYVWADPLPDDTTTLRGDSL